MILMKQINEIKRLQQLAGINEIRINNPILKKIIIIPNIDYGGFSFHSHYNKWINDKLDNNISAICDIYKNVFVIWGLTREEANKLTYILESNNMKPILYNYKGDLGIKISNKYLEQKDL